MQGFFVLLRLDERNPDPGAFRSMKATRAERAGRRWTELDAPGPIRLAARVGEGTTESSGPIAGPEAPGWLLWDSHFANGADVERAWQEHGPDAPNHLPTNVALAAWQPERGALWMATDAFGTRPVYWSVAGGVFIAATSLPMVLAHPEVSAQIDDVAVADFLVGYTWDERRTMFREVRRLAPGHGLSVRVDGRAVQVQPWWDPAAAADRLRPVVDPAVAWRAVLERAVARRLPPDGPTGVMLSGGIDSSSVAALVRSLRPDGEVHAATYAFRTLTECDERRWSRPLARRLSATLSEIPVEDMPLLDDPTAYRPPLATPFMAWETADRALLGALQDVGVGTVLTGHAGDLLAAGSARALASRLRRGHLGVVQDVFYDRQRRAAGRTSARWFLEHAIRPLQDSRTAAGRPGSPGPGGAASVGVPPWVDPQLAGRTGLADGRPPRPTVPPGVTVPRDPARRDLVGRLMHPGGVGRAVRYLDRIADEMGLRIGHPFLDRELAELALAIDPWRHRGTGRSSGLGKVVHRDAMEGLLPEALRLRTDKANLTPYHEWSLRRPGAARTIAHLLRDPVSASLGYVDGDALRQLNALFQQGRTGPLDGALWWTICLETWLRRHRNATGPGATSDGHRLGSD